MTELTDTDVKMGRVIRNGLLVGVLGALLIVASCEVAGWHYDYLRQQLDQTHYLVTRPW